MMVVVVVRGAMYIPNKCGWILPGFPRITRIARISSDTRITKSPRVCM